jgi:hypothetical protein
MRKADIYATEIRYVMLRRYMTFSNPTRICAGILHPIIATPKSLFLLKVRCHRNMDGFCDSKDSAALVICNPDMAFHRRSLAMVLLQWGQLAGRPNQQPK